MVSLSITTKIRGATLYIRMKRLITICIVLLWMLVPFILSVLYPYVQHSEHFVSSLIIVLLGFVLFFSVVLHEVSHGFMANQCGDDTAKSAGRISLNPLKHISLIGTILFPLCMYIFNAPMLFGWAKPIPFNPLKLKRYPRDQVALILAGPIMNLALSFLFFIQLMGMRLLFAILYPYADIDIGLRLFEPFVIPDIAYAGWWFVFFEIGNFGIIINITLAGFNLIPFPPLDGYWILKALFPKNIVIFLSKIQPYGIIFIFIALYYNLLEKFLFPVSLLLGWYSILMNWVFV